MINYNHDSYSSITKGGFYMNEEFNNQHIPDGENKSFNEENKNDVAGGKSDPLDYYNPETGEFYGESNETEKSNEISQSSETEHSNETPIPEAGGSEQNNQGDNYGGNVQYKWNYDDYQKAIAQNKKPPKKKNKGLKAFLISVGSIFSVLVIVLASVGVWSLAKDGKIGILKSSSSTSSLINNSAVGGASLILQNKPTTSSSEAATGTASPIKMSNEQVVAAVGSSVVSIEIYDLSTVQVSAEGSGIIMTTDGNIITNEHVIDAADKIQVVTSDGKSYDATVVGKDLRTDLAVIKISATGLTKATFGNSDQIKVGEQVLAIGNPGGLEFAGSVTDGIVSALNRKIVSENNYSMNCIQTNAAINPGNSGGALVNMYGQVIGITSSKIAATGFEGMGFAIPINTATPIINSIIQFGYVKDRVKIGIQVQEISAYQASVFKIPVGLAVQGLDKTSDAFAKGIKVNDVITKINEIAVTSYDQFYQEESKSKPGDSVTLTISRGTGTAATTLEVKVVLAEDKGNTTTASTPSNKIPNPNGNG